jgi:hypothetical protein
MGGDWSVRVGSDRLHPASELAAGQQDPTPTAQAFYSNICTQPDYFPFIASTGVGFSQAKDIIQP